MIKYDFNHLVLDGGNNSLSYVCQFGGSHLELAREQSMNLPV